MKRLVVCCVIALLIGMSATVYAVNRSYAATQKLQLKCDELSRAVEERSEQSKEMEEIFRFVEVQEGLAKTQDERIRNQNKRLEELESSLLKTFSLIDRISGVQQGFSKTQNKMIDRQEEFFKLLEELRDQLLKSLPPDKK